MKISVIIPVYNVEKYIRETLNSIQNQTLADFEVLVINDDSPDNAQMIIDEFCAADSRFKSFKKLNGGVSDTRNYGLDRAQGEYVFFVDGDDVIPPLALETMYRTAREKNADMVVGVMQEFGLDGTRTIQVTKELAAKEYIDRYDLRLPWIFSVCNKLFRRSVIERHHIRFENVKYTEDGLFSFQFTFQAQVIAGCSTVVYHYRRRSFFEEDSATQAATEDYLRDLLRALDIILELSGRQCAVAVQEAQERDDGEFQYVVYAKSHMALYMAELYRKFIRIQLLKGFYRLLWKSDDGMLPLLAETLREYKRHLFPDMWPKIVEDEADLRLDEGILTREELVKRPLITVAVSDQVPEETVGRVIGALYSQRFPAFVVFVHGKHRSALEDVYLQKLNLTVLDESLDTAAFKQKVLKRIRSPYVAFLDEPVYLSANTYVGFYECLEKKPEIEFAACRIKLMDERERVTDCHLHDVCTLQAALPARQSAYYAIDWLMGNKLFRVSALRNRKITFTNDPAGDAGNCYRALSHEGVDRFFVVARLTQKEILKKVKNPLVKMCWRFRYGRLLSQTDKGRRRKAGERQKWVWDFKKQIIAWTPIRRKVLFVSVRGNQLLENSKAVYDAYDGKKYVWSHVSPQTTREIWQLYRHLFSSKVIVTDDYFRFFKSFRLKKKQKIIQIWHAGGAFKKFGLDNPYAAIGDREYHTQYDTVTVSAECVREKYASAFGLDVSKFRALGVPRTDKLFDHAYLREQREVFFQKYPQLAGKKLLLYAPTFREEGTKRIAFDPRLCWEEISRWLGDSRALIIKNHPVMKFDFLNGKTFDNILNMPKEDTSRLLIVCDALITDYSSVIFDAALLDKPLVFYCPDFDTYERDFYLDFPKEVYGELTKDQESLLAACGRALTAPDLSKLPQFRERFMGSCDGHSTERIVALIREKLDEK